MCRYGRLLILPEFDEFACFEWASGGQLQGGETCLERGGS
jgi:hypothetical protein